MIYGLKVPPGESTPEPSDVTLAGLPQSEGTHLEDRVWHETEVDANKNPSGTASDGNSGKTASMPPGAQAEDKPDLAELLSVVGTLSADERAKLIEALAGKR